MTMLVNIVLDAPQKLFFFLKLTLRLEEHWQFDCASPAISIQEARRFPLGFLSLGLHDIYRRYRGRAFA